MSDDIFKIRDCTRAEKFVKVKWKYFGTYNETCNFLGIKVSAPLFDQWSEKLEQQLDALLGPHGDAIFAAMKAVRESDG